MSAPDAEPETIGFFLVPQFPLLGFSAAIEPLRLANWISGRELYAWRLISKDGSPVAASNGISLPVQDSIASVGRLPKLFACAGVDGCHYRDKEVFAWLRRQARGGVELGALCTGTWLLARAGLLSTRQCTIHWEDAEALSAEFPQLKITANLFEVDRKRITCSGGTAGLDMMLSFIALRHGHDFAGLVAEEFLHHRIREGADEQRTGLERRIGSADPRLVEAVRLMESNVEQPLSVDEICVTSRVSLRHFQRLFRQRFGHSPTDYYRMIRLRHARQLLLHGSCSILEAALRSGFVSAAHFSRSYREHFQRTPRAERRLRNLGGRARDSLGGNPN
jgi:transcriptional regulator GlxA family with amidase domain